MKRKDWISLIAILIIIAIAALGEFISVQGVTAIALGNMWYILPMIILLTSAVIMAKRKGNHNKLFKSISWICFGLSVVFLFLSLDSFMHFFNVQDSSKKKQLADKTTLVMNDFYNMYKAYNDGVTKRKDNYESKLKTAIQLNNSSLLREIAPMQANWSPKDSKQFSKDWVENAMMPTYKAYSTSFDSISPKVNEAIIHNFNIFTAGGEFVSLQELYNLHKRALSENYRKLNPIEEQNDQSYELDYENRESEWKDSQDIFSKKQFSITGCIVFLILAFLGSLTFLCVKDDSVKKPQMRKNVQNVYESGHKL
ncbi:MAG: hypothetical protein K2N35_15120 [Muribaculaceae bacterium]|nr:hypothetical protein [Muribaculaceae bacterium]